MTNFYDNEDERSLDSFDSDISDDVDSSIDAGSTNLNEEAKPDEVKLARAESQFVLCSKFLAYLVLFLSAVAAGILAFYLTREQERAEFADNVSC